MSNENKSQTNQKLEYIDSLRGIAILMVIFVHTTHSVLRLPYRMNEIGSLGQLGVQLFFVVSAITLSISADLRQNETHKYKKFMLRRFFRIAPLYYIGVIWYFLYRSVKLSLETGIFQTAPAYTLPNILANVFFIHGFYPPANNEIVPGGWSIGTEMAFYVCFPWLFSSIKKIVDTRNKIQLVLLFALVICCWYFLEYLLITWAGIQVWKNSFVYYNLLNQLPVFLLGILAYFLNKDIESNSIPVIVHIFFSSLFGYITIALWRYRSPPFDPFMFIPFTIGIAFVFLYSIFARIKTVNFKFLQRIGQVSYSMYIWHFMFAWYGVGYLYQWLGYDDNPIVILGMYYIFVVVFSFVVAIASEKWIEKPGVQLGRRIVQKYEESSHQRA